MQPQATFDKLGGQALRRALGPVLPRIRKQSGEKMWHDRRKFLVRSSATLATLLASKDLPAAMTKSTVPVPPVARMEVVHDTYFGETLDDPYRWMENDKDPEWLS